MKKRTVVRPHTYAYVRANPALGLAAYNVGEVQIQFCPYMARDVAESLLRAADRLDPGKTAPPPWRKTNG
jgi:hypothetical protein